MKFDRRSFLAGASASLVASSWSAFADANPNDSANDSASKPLTVAAIGHTGRGNFGHGLDTVWLHLSETEVIAAADPDKAGLGAELKKLSIDRGFQDYRQMLAEVRPDIVAVCPRHADQHRDMVVACAQAGVKGIYIEKPFCRTPAEADEMKAACDEHKVKLAVAHRNRYHPTLEVIDRLIVGGKIGRLLEIRGRGKGDRRGGAEDLWVLGTHVLNLMAYFGGAPTSCSGVLLQDGRRINRHDVKEGAEGLGPMGGNEVHARYEMSRGVVGYFDSIANDGTKSAGFGLQLVGSEGLVNIQCDKHPLAWLCPGNPFEPTTKPRPWIPISTAGIGLPEPRGDLSELVSHHGAPARDLVLSIREDRQPVCNLAEGALTVEMVCAVFESHRLGSQAVEFPLKERQNSLTNL
ncbi:MAG: Gfo/Idh/MocA family oxidoreductase [Planctomycetota bacterium]|nr:Gfo/Idh/MocA family oxidoreductase [Planctomycetota bacterium]MDA1160792.1 Gfo/Idh/MocA family oxidoreductase [Planctomycetota bacterium]